MQHQWVVLFFLRSRCIINAVHKDLVSHALRAQPRKVCTRICGP